MADIVSAVLQLLIIMCLAYCAWDNHRMLDELYKMERRVSELFYRLEYTIKEKLDE